MKPVRLFRKRYFPDELIELKDDQILFQNEHLIITKWKVLKPREDIASGYSAYFLDQGIKVSRELDASGNLVYWYCDIIETVFDSAENAYTFCDLLVDVLVLPDGETKILDLDELADIITNGILSQEMIANALRRTNALLDIIYAGRFSELTQHIMKYCC